MLKLKSIWPILLHVFLGVLAKFVAPLFTLYYLGVIVFGALSVVNKRDRGYLAAKYGLYIMGLEILYRMSGYTISYELGKYATAGIFLCGMLARVRRSDAKPFLFYLLLLLPAIFLTHTDEGINTWRKMILFNMSGPISLAFAGMYFYRRKISELALWEILRWAVLPAISVVVLLFLGPSISSVSLTTESNFELSGGFGPNQVSTALGYFLLLFFFAIWNRKVLTVNRWTDYGLAALVAFRALLTFSRGGLFAFALAVASSFLWMWVRSNTFRKRAGKYGLMLLMLAVVGTATFFIANKMTGNWLLYRYQGLERSDAELGYRTRDSSYLAGREKFAEQEIELFKEHWLTGCGVGMAKVLGHEGAASHSEVTRLPAEHGIFGLFALLLLLVFYPWARIQKDRYLLSQQFFILFYVLGIMTMLHAAMRMALPGVVIGLSFAIIVPDKKFERRTG